MKKLLIGILALGSISAFAGFLGTPDQDPIVANLRSRFEKGVEPKADYLLQHAFKCQDMAAIRDRFDKIVYPSALRFEELNDFLTAFHEGAVKKNVLYSFNGNELIGAFKTSSGVIYDAFRVDSDGFLISEFSLDNKRTDAELTPISFSKGKVQSYTLCTPK